MKFLTPKQKREIANEIGEDKVAALVLKELDRLEMIIRDYELGFSLLTSKHKDNESSKPDLSLCLEDNKRFCKHCGEETHPRG